MDNILDRVVGWAEVNADLRINLLGWLSTRTDDQILEDAMEMVDALESTAYTDTVTRMGEMIMINVVEICTILLRNDVLRRDGRQEEDSGMGGAMESLEYHECDKIKLDLEFVQSHYIKWMSSSASLPQCPVLSKYITMKAL